MAADEHGRTEEWLRTSQGGHSGSVPQVTRGVPSEGRWLRERKGPQPLVTLDLRTKEALDFIVRPELMTVTRVPL